MFVLVEHGDAHELRAGEGGDADVSNLTECFADGDIGEEELRQRVQRLGTGL
ncbi:MAG TPA: hypothetical protein VGR26_13825 [Acidimicrobiales bacterium]|nr:hypothetical protein [Acidimicrobiales bacterium]